MSLRKKKVTSLILFTLVLALTTLALIYFERTYPSSPVPDNSPHTTSPGGGAGQNPPVNPVPKLDPVPGGNDGDMIACTMDAKQCPDGSYVGRTGPKCEFAPCPGG